MKVTTSSLPMTASDQENVGIQNYDRSHREAQNEIAFYFHAVLIADLMDSTMRSLFITFLIRCSTFGAAFRSIVDITASGFV
ncbi:MAG: hypothetical protein R3D26_25165 [Cyanobacteriota/Melainabacteria group bacterium]